MKKNQIQIYNENILKFLKQKYPQKWNNLNFIKKEEWITKKSFPTYNQLVEIAKIFNIPFGYLFLNKIPERKRPIPHFRTNNYSSESISEELYDTIIQVQRQQEWIKDILLGWGQNELPFAGKYTTKTDINKIVNQMRELLQLKTTWAEEKISWNEAIKFLIERFEEKGIFVVINGIVGNNTHRKLDVNEFRGFVLYDNIAPFVFVNNNDFVSAKIFTLIHELVHILIGQSASFDLRQMQSANNEIEQFCDKCTAEFLVPRSDIEDISQINYEDLARKFKVSQIVIARRLLDIKKISNQDFFKFYNNYGVQEKRQLKGKGGYFYNTINYRYGKRFLKLLKSAVQNEQILYRDFYRLLSLKPTTSDKILNIF